MVRYEQRHNRPIHSEHKTNFRYQSYAKYPETLTTEETIHDFAVECGFKRSLRFKYAFLQ